MPSGFTGSATTISKYPVKNSAASESLRALIDLSNASLKLVISGVDPSFGSAFSESATKR